MASVPQTYTAPTAPLSARGTKLRVLVVDDEIAFAAVMREVLDAFGLDVHVAHNARDAIRRIRHEPPDLMLIDVMMPEVDGLSLIRRIQKEQAWVNIPIVVISARAGSQDRNEAMFAGADGFLGKPFTSEELRAALRPFLPQNGKH
ncbi:MAG TPA: response regulator [Anaerolineales bacterium]|nr:response regulator [Anaerolineales bacterium]